MLTRSLNIRLQSFVASPVCVFPLCDLDLGHPSRLHLTWLIMPTNSSLTNSLTRAGLIDCLSVVGWCFWLPSIVFVGFCWKGTVRFCFRSSIWSKTKSTKKVFVSVLGTSKRDTEPQGKKSVSFVCLLSSSFSDCIKWVCRYFIHYTLN